MTYENLHATAAEILENKDIPLEKVPVNVLAQHYLQTIERIDVLLAVWQQAIEDMTQSMAMLDADDPESAKEKLRTVANTMHRLGCQLQ